MAMVVKNNMSAVRTLNTLNTNSTALQKSLAKVSSGMKINSAQDDASGYAISERMRVQIRSLDQANQNTQNASSLMKTAEGAVSSTVEILKSLKEKAINAATDTNTDQDRATIQKELNQFIDQIDDNALTTFNGKYLVDGSKSQSGTATFTAMTNQSLGVTDINGDNLGGTTALTNLTNRNLESLEIQSTDSVTASFVKNGETYTTTYKVNNTTVEDIFKNLNSLVNDGSASSASSSSSAAASSGPTAAQTQAVTNAIDAISTAWYANAGNTTLTGFNVPDGLRMFDAYINELKQTGSDGKYATSITTIQNSTAYNGQSQTPTISGGVLTTVQGYFNNINADWGTALTNAINSATAAYAAAVTAYNQAVDDAGSGGGGSATAAAGDAFGPANVNEPGSSIVYSGSDIGIAASLDMVSTANGETGLTVTAASSGINGQISGLTISITDSEGNVKKSANAALDDFKTTVYAKNASDANEMTFQVGAKANQSITVGLDDMRAEALGLKGNSGTKVSVATQDKANAAVAVFDNAIQKALDQQATIGAIEARLEYTSQNLTTSSENVQAAESTIRDADMAKEMTNYTRNNVLLQAAQSMLAQANQNSSAVLSLLQ